LAVEDEAVFQQPHFQQFAERAKRQAFFFEVDGVDREALVVVAVPGDVRFEIDVAAEQAETEASRFTQGFGRRFVRLRDDVVDGDDKRGRNAREVGDDDLAFADFRVERAGGGVRVLTGPDRASGCPPAFCPVIRS
jgi:hypothetical protein